MEKQQSKAGKHPDSQCATVRLVGIGSSAGGLEALRDLMESLLGSDELTYVIAQHVSPTHVSMMMNLLAPLTSLEVRDVSDRQVPKAGTVYITPPNKDVVLKDGLLRLTKPQKNVGPKPSVNHFFHSLADEMGEQAIGIILSGTGSDGAAGLRAIKAVGGITIAQEPDSAKYDGMPKAAIHTGSVDLILRPAEIGPALDRLVTHHQNLQVVLEEGQETDEYVQINNLVRLNTIFRLSDYKSSTVRRRIARRMNILGIHTLKDYIEYLRSQKDEAHLLVRDTFISVTAFFRDAEPFFALEQIIGDIVRKQTKQRVIRCWVPGCATGEEAYSIAMLFEEALRKQDRSDLQYMIFASDLDDAALEKAREARYPVSDLESMPNALRDRYTEVEGDYLQLLKSIRNRLVVARQNVIEDPPFARLDLISCRNLLIYLNPSVQQRVLKVFHYSLNPDGYLLLGKSESADAHKDLFKAVDNRARIYSRLEGVAHYELPMSQGMPIVASDRLKYMRNATASTDLISMQVLESLVERYAPPSLVINELDNVVHFQGNLKPYLDFPKGSAKLYLFDLFGTSVRAELRALVYRCRRDLQTVQGGSWPLEIDGKPHVVTPVISLLEPSKRQLLLISLQVSLAKKGKTTVEHIGGDERDKLIISELEQELANTRTHLNIVIEELETSNEELQSINEELQSANEELQSTNEELQTSNEELQSTNEELITVNEELQVKSTELEATASDLINVKQSLAFPLIVMDTKLRITQVNAACDDILAIDIPMEHSSLHSVQWLVEASGLIGTVRRVIKTGEHYEETLRGEGSTVYRLHVMPYRNPQDEIGGVVLLFEDITDLHAVEGALKKSNERFDLAVRGSSDGLWDWDISSNEVYLAPRFKEILGYHDEEMESSFEAWESRMHPDDKVATLAALKACLKEETTFDEEYRLRHKSGDYIWIKTRGQVVCDRTGNPVRMAGSITNITERKLAEDELRLAASVFSNTLDGIIIAAPDGTILKVNEAFERITGYSSEEIVGRNTRLLSSNRQDAEFYSKMWKTLMEAGSWQGEIWDRHKDGRVIPVWLSISSVKDQAGTTDRYIAIVYDISEQKDSQEHINRLAHYDALTGLPNRSLFMDRLSHAINRAKRQGRSLALMFIDLDNFKHVNDSFGHPVGDQLLCQIADRLKRTTRESDSIARLSGDEFTLLIEDASNLTGVRLTAQKVLKALADPVDLEDDRIFISASIGIALFPEDGRDMDTLVKNADLAMYRSKEGGRNQFHFYAQEMSNLAQERMILNNELRHALDTHELILHFQPIMDVGTRHCVGAESLIRWKHHVMGWVPTNKFIAVAEDNNLIHPLGEWVLYAACRQMKVWLDANITLDFMSINVSGKQIVNGDFVSAAQNVLEVTQCPPDRIVLELTESFIMRESEGAMGRLNKLRDLGFGIAIDDFGTGYSSLAYLKRLPVTTLKLDQSFVRDIPGDSNDVAIARAILKLGDILGLKVVAEGVETDEQHSFVFSEGCSLSQGYLYAKPMPVIDFMAYMGHGGDESPVIHGYA